MALPATDVFTSASDQTLTAYSANWTNNHNVFQVVGATDRVRANTASADCMAHWNADAFNNAQYAQGVITLEFNDGGVAVRCHASAATGYALTSSNFSTGTTYLYKYVTGTYTEISHNTEAWASSDTVRLEVSGTTLTPKRNGALSSIGTQTDSAISSGSAGLAGYNNVNQIQIDNWEGGNLVTNKATPIFHRRNYVWRRGF